jgi:hypothetical protein
MRAAPSEIFREMVGLFLADTNQIVPYAYAHFRLQPIGTTGQIRLLNYKKGASASPPDLSADQILHHLNPMHLMTASYASVATALNNITYRCPHCGTDNPLHHKTCIGCQSMRPKLPIGAVLAVLLRACVDMTYVLYVAVAISFLLVTLFYAFRY